MKRFKREVRMATIKDVAKESGLSVGTVSRYLNGGKLKKKNELILEETIRKLDFKINYTAKALKTNKTFTIGVVVPSLIDPFCNRVIEGIDETLEQMHFSLIACGARNKLSVEKEKLEFLLDKRVDGIILMPISTQSEHIQEIIDSGTPVVLIDRIIDGISCDAVITDSWMGAAQATKYLIHRGHSRIGIISGPKNIYTAKQRLKGYLETFQKYNVPIIEEMIVYGKYERGGGDKAIKELLAMKERPTAIFATNYETTISALKHLLEMGIKIGEDISFCGFDTSDILHVITPAITTIAQPMYELGSKAMRLLNRRINGDGKGFPMILKLPTELLIRDSVADIRENNKNNKRKEGSK